MRRQEIVPVKMIFSTEPKVHAQNVHLLKDRRRYLHADYLDMSANYRDMPLAEVFDCARQVHAMISAPDSIISDLDLVVGDLTGPVRSRSRHLFTFRPTSTRFPASTKNYPQPSGFHNP
jgi:hypothetical protein